VLAGSACSGELHNCARCHRYYSFSEAQEAAHAPCRYHPGAYGTGASGGDGAGLLAFASSLSPYWKCCGASEQDAAGCQVSNEHVQDGSFEKAAALLGQYNRAEAAKQWPPPPCVPPEAATAAPAGSAAPMPSKDKQTLLENGWKEVTVGRNDTLMGLALKHGVQPALLRLANRLSDDSLLMSHTSLLVPPRGWDPAAGGGGLAPQSEEQSRAAAVHYVQKAAGLASPEEARFYLDMAGGDVHSAVEDCRADKEWENHSSAAVVGGAS